VKASARSLVQTVNGLFEMTNIVGLLRMNKTMWLLHINFLSQMIMKKDILNILLMKRPIKGNDKRKNKVDSGGINNGIESLMIIIHACW